MASGEVDTGGKQRREQRAECRAYGAGDVLWAVDPGFTPWANLWRALRRSGGGGNDKPKSTGKNACATSQETEVTSRGLRITLASAGQASGELENGGKQRREQRAECRGDGAGDVLWAAADPRTGLPGQEPGRTQRERPATTQVRSGPPPRPGRGRRQAGPTAQEKPKSTGENGCATSQETGVTSRGLRFTLASADKRVAS